MSKVEIQGYNLEQHEHSQTDSSFQRQFGDNPLEQYLNLRGIIGQHAKLEAQGMIPSDIRDHIALFERLSNEPSVQAYLRSNIKDRNRQNSATIADSATSSVTADGSQKKSSFVIEEISNIPMEPIFLKFLHKKVNFDRYSFSAFLKTKGVNAAAIGALLTILENLQANLISTGMKNIKRWGVAKIDYEAGSTDPAEAILSELSPLLAKHGIQITSEEIEQFVREVS